jgi:hypothetical protein
VVHCGSPLHYDSSLRRPVESSSFSRFDFLG